MNFKKYNILVIFLLIIICGTSVASFVIKDTISKPSDPDDGIEDPIVPEDPGDPTAPAAPKFSSAWAAYKYAYDKMFNGQGFASTTYQSLEPKVPVPGLKLSQNVVIDKRCNGASEALIKTNSKGVTSFFEVIYRKDANFFIRQNNASVDDMDSFSNFSGATQKFDEKGYLAKKGFLPCEFMHVINADNCKPTAFVFDGKKYKFTMQFSNLTDAHQTYLEQIKVATGSASVPVMNSISIEFEVNAKTGYFTKIKSNENFTISMYGLKIETDSISTEVFSKMNTVVKIAKPEYI